MADEQNHKDSSEDTGIEDSPSLEVSEKSNTTSANESAQESSELDPELIRLPRPATRIRPIMAMAIVAICVVLVVRLWNDLSFSRESEMVSVDSISDLNPGLIDRYIEINATPDRQQAIRLLPSRKTSGPVLMPVLGNSKNLWVFVHPTPWTETIRADETYRGRLSRLSDQNYYETLVEYYASGKFVARSIEIGEVAKALATKSSKISDLSGESFAIDGSTYVRFRETSVSKVRIVANAGATLVDEATWRIALDNAGLLEGAGRLDQSAVSHTIDSWTFEVPLRSGIQEIESMLTEAKLFAAKAAKIDLIREGKWDELRLEGEEILLRDAQSGYTLDSIALGLAIEIPTDAYILNTTETPQTYWYMLALVLLLACFAAIFLYGIVANFRRR